MTVYIAPRSETRTYHTDPACHILQKATDVAEKDESPWYYTECKVCAGREKQTKPTWEHQKALHKAAKK